MGGSRGIRRVSLFETYNSVVARGFSRADGKIDEVFVMKNHLDKSGGKKQLVFSF